MKREESETSAFGTEGHINVFTGEFQKPVILDWSKGGKNIHTLGTSGDTTAFRQNYNTLKDKLSQLLPSKVKLSILNESDIINVNLIDKYRNKRTIINEEVKWLPLEAIKKLLEYYKIEYEDTM